MDIPVTRYRYVIRIIRADKLKLEAPAGTFDDPASETVFRSVRYRYRHRCERQMTFSDVPRRRRVCVVAQRCTAGSRTFVPAFYNVQECVYVYVPRAAVYLWCRLGLLLLRWWRVVFPGDFLVLLLRLQKICNLLNQCNRGHVIAGIARRFDRHVLLELYGPINLYSWSISSVMPVTCLQY